MIETPTRVRVIMKTRKGLRYLSWIDAKLEITEPGDLEVLAIESYPGRWQWDAEEGREAVERMRPELLRQFRVKSGLDVTG